MAAAHFGLDNLTVIVDRNGLQQGDATEQTVAPRTARRRWRAFGWARRSRSTATTSMALLRTSSTALPLEPGRPTCVIAHTQQGPGRLVHGGPRRVAPSRADRRGTGRGAGGAGEASAMTRPPRLPRRLCRDADRAGRSRPPHRRGGATTRSARRISRSSASASRIGWSMSASPSRTWSASAPAWPTAARSRSSAARPAS